MNRTTRGEKKKSELQILLPVRENKKVVAGGDVVSVGPEGSPARQSSGSPALTGHATPRCREVYTLPPARPCPRAEPPPGTDAVGASPACNRPPPRAQGEAKAEASPGGTTTAPPAPPLRRPLRSVPGRGKELGTDLASIVWMN